MKTSRLSELDTLRGIAAIAVVIFHYTSRYDRIDGLGYEDGSPIEFYIGKFGVELFFMISGFVIFMSMGKLPSSYQGLKSFAVSRFSRIYPAFWVSVIITFTVVAIFGLAGREVTKPELLVNLTMIPAIFGIPMADGVYWTLEKELFFYFWMALVLLFNMRKHIRFLLVVWLIFANILEPTAYLAEWDHDFLYRALEKFLILQWIPFFAIGIVAFKKYSEGDYKLVDLGIIALCFLRISQDRTLFALLVIAGIFIIIQLLALKKLEWLEGRTFVFLGAISYSLYLIHQNIGYIIIRETLPIFNNHWVSWLLAISASLAIATIITFCIERPVMRLIRGLQKKNKTTKLMVAT